MWSLLLSLKIDTQKKEMVEKTKKKHEEEEEEEEEEKGERFRLVGYEKFVRKNPKSDKFQVLRFHHVEFWCTDATNASRRFSWGLGMPIVAKSDLSTSNHHHASYLLRSGDLHFLFTAPYSPSIVAADASSAIPSFRHAVCNRFVVAHGLAVRAVSLEVANAVEAFEISVANGARPSFSPAVVGCGGDEEEVVVIIAEVELYGDVVLRYISFDEKSSSGMLRKKMMFLPGFEEVLVGKEALSSKLGLRRLDHAVGNVENLAAAVEYVKGFTGFNEFAS